jgi:hypothetical protein
MGNLPVVPYYLLRLTLLWNLVEYLQAHLSGLNLYEVIDMI